MTPRGSVRILALVSVFICDSGGAPAQENNDPMANTPRHTNHLVHETSPYLLQHAHNPVDWYPWGDEALQRARKEDKPIFLSIGYAACHWCHVMERESFENEDIAKIINEHFIPIKVDREERPDLDEIYMTAVVGLTGSGGWPMSVWLTPELKPFYGGTYYPPVDHYGRPGFGSVLLNIAHAWQQRRGEVDKSAEGVSEYIARQLTTSAPTTNGVTLDATPLLDACEHLRNTFDNEDGGWGHAPKFPSSGSIQLLLRAYRRTADPNLLRMATHTLERMASGGMYDQLAGGFHRYSVDAEWLVPHFEKMLYDNAQLVPAYLEAWQLTKLPLFRRIATEVLDYEIRDMRDALGAFHSTEDADSEGEEGKFYIWTRAQIIDALGPADGELFSTYYGVLPNGNFNSHEHYHRGTNILHLPRRPAEVAKELGITEAELEQRLAPMRAKLLQLRAQRTRPGLDDKVLTAWNGLMISALAQGYRVLGDSRYRDAATAAGSFILRHMRADGHLLRTHRHGKSHLEAYLDDYANTANAFIDLYEATFDRTWLHEADLLATEMLQRLWDPGAKLFHYTSDTHQHLLIRTKPTYDGAEPSGNSTAALMLQRLGRHLGKNEYLDTAHGILSATHAQYSRAPQAFLKMLLALDYWVYPPHEIAITANSQAEAQPLLDAVYRDFVPNKLVAFTTPQQVDSPTTPPLLQDKTLRNNRPTAYVCHNYTCDAPQTAPDALAQLLQR